MAHQPLKKRTRRLLAAGIGLTLTAAGGTAWALDRYVIDHVEYTNVSEMTSSSSTAASATTQATASDSASATSTTTDIAAEATYELTDDFYTSSDGTSISITKVVTGSGNDTVTYYVADVVLADATDLQTGFANDSFGENIVADTSAIAEASNAVFAINGDYYGFRSTGIEVRNGILFRDAGARTGLALYTDGTAAVYDETTTSGADLVAQGVYTTLSFGPALIVDGQIQSGISDFEVDTNFGNHSIEGEQPRTAIGWISANHYVFVVVDGRDPGYSRGVTMTELADIMASLGCQVAYNLDGGGSSTMYFNGQVVNQPSQGSEREVSDILYVGLGS